MVVEFLVSAEARAHIAAVGVPLRLRLEARGFPCERGVAEAAREPWSLEGGIIEAFSGLWPSW